MPGKTVASRRISVDQMNELVTVVDAEFGEKAVQVSLDRAYRNDQPVGDLAVGQPGRDQTDDLTFTSAEGKGVRRGLERRRA